MGAVLGFLDLVRRDPELSEDSRKHLERAVQEGGRVRAILRQLLDFSRPPRVTTSPVDLLGVAERTVELVRAQRRYAEVGFDVRGDPAAPLALGDPDRLAQILLNLLLNAADAALDGEHALVAVEVRGVPTALRAGDPAGSAEARRGFDAVECRVRDSGPGVAVEDRERVFDPFFTSKPPGQGTGLGLPNALRLAEQLGGSVELAQTGGGTEFVLRLMTAEPPEAGSETRS
jgi:two-component system NtrC family sensor kinase